jgi:hypothetical protein
MIGSHQRIGRDDAALKTSSPRRVSPSGASSRWLTAISRMRPALLAACLRASIVALPVALLPAIACGSNGASNGDAGVTPDVFLDAPEEPETNSEVVCATDQDCNDNSMVSSLFGRCFAGLCFCVPLFYVQESGKCGPVRPPACAEQGGECHQGWSTCPAGTVEGDSPANAACNDAGAAVCCMPEAICHGHGAFTCCSVDSIAHAPVCVNGWRTCPRGFVPTRDSSCN